MSAGVMLFSPFTGKPRHPSDIASDPRGVLVWDGEEPLRLAAQPEPIAAEPVATAVAVKRLEKHVLRAGDCPGDSKVVLWSAINRLATPAREVPAGECFNNGTTCARCGHSEVIAAPAPEVPADRSALDGEALETAQRLAYEYRTCRQEHARDAADRLLTFLAPRLRPAAPEAPAQPGQGEPVAWLDEEGDRAITGKQKRRALNDGGASASSVKPFTVAAYTAPPARKRVTEAEVEADLLDEAKMDSRYESEDDREADRNWCRGWNAYREADYSRKWSSAIDRLEAAAQQHLRAPGEDTVRLDWIWQNMTGTSIRGTVVNVLADRATLNDLRSAIDAAPPAAERKPLTDFEASDLFQKWDATAGASYGDLIRMIERAHGITASPAGSEEE